MSLLSARSLTKSYGSPVLRDVSFDLRSGEVHALVGENGAGKSTLSRILSGVTLPDTGTMQLRGKPYAPGSKAEAEARGVGIVFQELNVIGTMTVAEQVLFGSLPHRFGVIQRRLLRARAAEVLQRVGLTDLDPDRRMGSLGISVQQLVTVAACLARRYQILILDEPTAALSEEQAATLFERIAELRASGSAVIYISHRLEEVIRLADRISVLRDGRLVATQTPSETSTRALVELMVGRDVSIPVHHAVTPGEVVLRVKGLQRPPAVLDVSFDLRRGEILGLAGLMGSGRSETVRALCGADRARAGELEIMGQPLRPFASPHDAIRRGLALVTENRKEEGLLLPLAIRPNVTLPTLRTYARRGVLRQSAETAAAATWVQRLGISARSVEQPVRQLSGGNQQKVVLAKWLQRDPEILVCDEPTRGIDVAARFEIHRLLLKLAGAGKAILVVSSELEELLEVCHRIVVLSLGRVTATFERTAFSQEAILRAALVHHEGRRIARTRRA